jgi:ubiquitin
MKMYTNGQRKAMMYGGMSKRKPMMYGGMAQKKKPRKKAQAGGMMSTTQQQQQMQQNKMPMMGMKGGGKAFPDLTGDGKVDKKDILKGRGVPGFQEGGEARRTPSDQDMIRAGEMVAGMGLSKREKKALEDAMGRKLSDQDIKNIMKAFAKDRMKPLR